MGAPMQTDVAEGGLLETHSETIVCFGVVPRVGIAYILVPLRGPARSRFVPHCGTQANPNSVMWCRGWESNPHSRRNKILSLACIPVSPPRHIYTIANFLCLPTLPRNPDVHRGVYTSLPADRQVSPPKHAINKPDYCRQYVSLKQAYFRIFIASGSYSNFSNYHSMQIKNIVCFLPIPLSSF